MALAKAKASKKAKAKAKLSPAEKEKQERQARREALQALRETPAFKGFSNKDMYSTEINAKTLFQTIQEANLLKIRGSESAPKFGGPWYKALGAAFRGEKSDELRRAEGSDEMQLSPALIAALMEWNDVPRNPGPLMEYLTLAEEVLLLNYFSKF